MVFYLIKYVDYYISRLKKCYSMGDIMQCEINYCNRLKKRLYSVCYCFCKVVEVGY